MGHDLQGQVGLTQRRKGQTERGSGQRRVFVYSIPLIALVIVAGVYYAATLPPTAQESFTVQLSIKVYSIGTNGSTVSQYVILPPVGVSGVPGAIRKASVYDSEGLAGNYPLYTDAPPFSYPGYSIVHVVSKVNMTYYLGDFFDVWGNVISANDTMGLTVPPPASSTQFHSDWYWQMCVGPDTNHLSRGLWGREPLTPNLKIFMFYSNIDPVCF